MKKMEKKIPTLVKNAILVACGFVGGIGLPIVKKVVVGAYTLATQANGTEVQKAGSSPFNFITVILLVAVVGLAAYILGTKCKTKDADGKTKVKAKTKKDVDSDEDTDSEDELTADEKKELVTDLREVASAISDAQYAGYAATEVQEVIDKIRVAHKKVNAESTIAEQLKRMGQKIAGSKGDVAKVTVVIDNCETEILDIIKKYK